MDSSDSPDIYQGIITNIVRQKKSKHCVIKSAPFFWKDKIFLDDLHILITQPIVRKWVFFDYFYIRIFEDQKIENEKDNFPFYEFEIQWLSRLNDRSIPWLHRDRDLS